MKLHSLFLIDLYELVVCLNLYLVFRFRNFCGLVTISKTAAQLVITWQAKYSLMQPNGPTNFSFKNLGFARTHISTEVKITGSAMCESHCFIITDNIFNDINVINLNIKLNTADSLVLKAEVSKIFFNLIYFYGFHFLDKIKKFYR